MEQPVKLVSLTLAIVGLVLLSPRLAEVHPVSSQRLLPTRPICH
jgi:hypothetical protein